MSNRLLEAIVECVNSGKSVLSELEAGMVSIAPVDNLRQELLIIRASLRIGWVQRGDATHELLLGMVKSPVAWEVEYVLEKFGKKAFINNYLPADFLNLLEVYLIRPEASPAVQAQSFRADGLQRAIAKALLAYMQNGGAVPLQLQLRLIFCNLPSIESAALVSSGKFEKDPENISLLKAAGRNNSLPDVDESDVRPITGDSECFATAGGPGERSPNDLSFDTVDELVNSGQGGLLPDNHTDETLQTGQD